MTVAFHRDRHGRAESNGIFAAAKMTYLSRDETAPKMGHPILGSAVRCGPLVLRRNKNPSHFQCSISELACYRLLRGDLPKTRRFGAEPIRGVVQFADLQSPLAEPESSKQPKPLRSETTASM
jgi:hypothetical protein